MRAEIFTVLHNFLQFVSLYLHDLDVLQHELVHLRVNSEQTVRRILSLIAIKHQI